MVITRASHKSRINSTLETKYKSLSVLLTGLPPTRSTDLGWSLQLRALSEVVEHQLFWTHTLWVSLLVTETVILVTAIRIRSPKGQWPPNTGNLSVGEMQIPVRKVRRCQLDFEGQGLLEGSNTRALFKLAPVFMCIPNFQ